MEGERGEWGGGQLLTKEAVLVAAGNYILPLMNELDAVKGRFNDTDTDEAIVIPEIPYIRMGSHLLHEGFLQLVNRQVILSLLLP